MLKDYMLVEIPIYIDWSIFGENISDEKKQELLQKMKDDLIDKPIINNTIISQKSDSKEDFLEYTDQRVEGIITKANIVGDDKISAFGLMWVESIPEFQKNFSQKTGEYNLKLVGVNITYDHKLNKTFQQVTEMKNKINRNFKKTIDTFQKDKE